MWSGAIVRIPCWKKSPFLLWSSHAIGYWIVKFMHASVSVIGVTVAHVHGKACERVHAARAVRLIVATFSIDQTWFSLRRIRESSLFGRRANVRWYVRSKTELWLSSLLASMPYWRLWIGEWKGNDFWRENFVFSHQCRQVISKRCRCGAKEKAIPCCQEFLCEIKCTRMRACGKHPCKRKVTSRTSSSVAHRQRFSDWL